MLQRWRALAPRHAGPPAPTVRLGALRASLWHLATPGPPLLPPLATPRTTRPPRAPRRSAACGYMHSLESSAKSPSMQTDTVCNIGVLCGFVLMGVPHSEPWLAGARARSGNGSAAAGRSRSGARARAQARRGSLPEASVPRARARACGRAARRHWRLHPRACPAREGGRTAAGPPALALGRARLHLAVVGATLERAPRGWVGGGCRAGARAASQSGPFTHPNGLAGCRNLSPAALPACLAPLQLVRRASEPGHRWASAGT